MKTNNWSFIKPSGMLIKRRMREVMYNPRRTSSGGAHKPGVGDKQSH